MRKNIIYICTILAVGLLSGCSSDNKNDTQEKTQKEVSASGIEVVQNKNSKEIKVAAKEHDKKDKQYYFDYDVKSAYSQDARPANEDASVRSKPRSAVDANIHVRSPYERVQISLLVKGLSKNFMSKCSACHDDYANGVVGPSLLGKSTEFIIKKINKFKNDKDANVLMYGLVSHMSDKEIKEIAQEIYDFNEKIKQIREKK